MKRKRTATEVIKEIEEDFRSLAQQLAYGNIHQSTWLIEEIKKKYCLQQEKNNVFYNRFYAAFGDAVFKLVIEHQNSEAAGKLLSYGQAFDVPQQRLEEISDSVSELIHNTKSQLAIEKPFSASAREKKTLQLQPLRGGIGRHFIKWLPRWVSPASATAAASRDINRLVLSLKEEKNISSKTEQVNRLLELLLNKIDSKMQKAARKSKNPLTKTELQDFEAMLDNLLFCLETMQSLPNQWSSQRAINIQKILERIERRNSLPPVIRSKARSYAKLCTDEKTSKSLNI